MCTCLHLCYGNGLIRPYVLSAPCVQSRGLAKVWPAVSPPTLFSMPTQLFTAQRWPKQKIHVRLTNGRQAQAISELGETQARPSGDEDAAPQAAQQPAQPAMSTPTIVRSRGKRKRKEQS